MRLYVHIMYSQNPFFDLITEVHLSKFYSIIYSVGIVILAVYVFYLMLISYKALIVIRFLKKTYRYAIGSTFFVIIGSCSIMLVNGQAS
jgi:hypothetical protein